MRAIVKIAICVILIVILSSCEDSNIENLKYDCYHFITKYLGNDEIEDWAKHFYKNNRIVRYEDSYENLYEYEYKYDNRGNLISETSNENRTDYEYDLENRLIKIICYEENEISHYYIYDKIDSLTQNIYGVRNGDTIDITRYFYGNDNILDSIINDRTKSYYSEYIDSTLYFSDNKIFLREYFKYENGLKVLQEEWRYNLNGQVVEYEKRTWEYNSNNLEIRSTYELRYDNSNSKRYSETKKYYNSSLLLIKSEVYNELNDLIYYTNYTYDVDKLTRTDGYNSQDSLLGYTIYETTCDW